MMGLFDKTGTKQSTTHFAREAFFRATAASASSDLPPAFAGRSAYMHDLLDMCRQGAWGWQLRQCMPPASLHESVDALVELGWIERSKGEFK
jgi:hypothetical protein